MYASIVTMASFGELGIIILIAVCATFTAGGDLCTNQWYVNVGEIPSSDLTVHHSSTIVPETFTHLVWHWRSNGKLSGTLWVSQHRYKGKFNGGFISQSRSLFHLPASFMWSLTNNTLRLSTHGDSRELAQYPAWNVSVCDELLVWGVTADKELYVIYDDVNESRSLDEAFTSDRRLKRQAEFPSGAPELPSRPSNNNSTITAWWYRFLNAIGANSQGDRARSWAVDLTEMILKLIFSGGRGQRPTTIPTDPDAEVIPGRPRDVERVPNDVSRPTRVPRHVIANYSRNIGSHLR